jgi:hypothetical protein
MLRDALYHRGRKHERPGIGLNPPPKISKNLVGPEISG